MKSGRLLDTPEKRTGAHGFYSIFSSRRHHHHYHQHHGSEYFPEEFKKDKPPTCDGELKKSKDAEAWLLGMRKFFRLHDYLENLKS